MSDLLTVTESPHVIVVLAPLWMRIVAGIIGISVCVVGGIGNLTVLVAFATHRHMWIKQNIFLFCLTLSDLSMTTLATAQVLDQYLSGRWRYSRAWCRAFLTILSLSFVSSLNFVALISRDRMLMVVKGAGYDAYESSRRKWLLALANCVLLLVTLIPYTSLDIFTGVSLFDTTGRCDPEQIQNLFVTVANQLVFTMVPFCLMLYYYARVRRYIHKRSVRVGGTTANTATVHTVQHSNKPVRVWAATGLAKKMEKTNRAVRIMNVLLVSTFLNALPATVTSMMINVLMAYPTLVEPETFQWWWHFYGLSYMSCYVSNAINPILYAYAMPSYRDAARDVYQALWRLLRLKNND